MARKKIIPDGQNFASRQELEDYLISALAQAKERRAGFLLAAQKAQEAREQVNEIEAALEALGTLP